MVSTVPKPITVSDFLWKSIPDARTLYRNIWLSVRLDSRSCSLRYSLRSLGYWGLDERKQFFFIQMRQREHLYLKSKNNYQKLLF